MTNLDMKYTSLFCRLGFIEETMDVYIKPYSDNYHIVIDAEKQEINYGINSKSSFATPNSLIEHKDFVILECVNNLLEKGYLRTNLEIIKNANRQFQPDIIVSDKMGNPFLIFECKRWGDEYDFELIQLRSGVGITYNYEKEKKNIQYRCLYSSRLDGGLLEWRFVILDTTEKLDSTDLYYKGIFEKGIEPYNVKPVYSESERTKYDNAMDSKLSKIENIKDFVIKDGKLIRYLGNQEHITIPYPLLVIDTGAFWNCANLVSVKIPNGIKRIGGDAFYSCSNLKEVNIPQSTIYIGNDPFAGCPNVSLINESPNFYLEEGILYNNKKTILIHYPINKQISEFIIPDGVEFIGKHAFYNCNNLQTITIPRSVKWIENNIFAGCKNLQIYNNSPYFSIDNGVLYNKEETQLYSVFDHSLKELIPPKTLKTIGRNSFFKCDKLQYFEIPQSITRIGYNPFVGCSSLKLKNYSHKYIHENGLLLNKEKTKIIYCPNTSVNQTVEIPKSVQIIGRNSFSYCFNLISLDIPKTVNLIERGAFSGCKNLKEISIPNSINRIGKWCFSYCSNLKSIRIPKETIIGEYLFAGSDVELLRY